MSESKHPKAPNWNAGVCHGPSMQIGAHVYAKKLDTRESYYVELVSG